MTGRLVATLGVALGVLLAAIGAPQAARADEEDPPPPTPGVITGVVTDERGEPLTDVLVEALYWSDYWGWPEAEAETRTAEDGTYRLEVRPTRYLMSFSQHGRVATVWDTDRSTPGGTWFDLPPGQEVSGIDVAMPPAPLVSGRVRDPGGQPLAGIEVVLERWQVDEEWGSGSWVEEAVLRTDDTGRYQRYVHPARYRILFRDPNAMDDWDRAIWPARSYPTGASFAEAAEMEFEPGGVYSGIDMTMQPGAVVTGRMRPLGRREWRPADELPTVNLYRLVAGRWAWMPRLHHSVSARGAFRIGLLPPGRYRIGFEESSTHFDVWFGGAPSPRGAREVVLRAGAVRSGTDVTVAEKGSISGVVRDTHGRPVPGVQVTWVSPLGADGPQTTTDSAGRYRFRGLSDGFYRVGVFYRHETSVPQYIWWPRTRNVTDAVDIGLDRGEHRRDVVLVRPPEVRSGKAGSAPPASRRDRERERDVPRGSLGGRTMSPKGVLLTGIWVAADRRVGSSWVRSGSDVSYHSFGSSPHYWITSQEAGDYRLRAVDRQWRFYADEWFGGARTAAGAEVVRFDPERDSRRYVADFRLDPQVRAFARPHLTGSPVVGRTLAVRVGLWSPDDTTRTFQWLRAGRPVAGATGPRYRVTTADLGRRLQVRVTGRRPGMLQRVVVSEPTSPVR